MTLLRWLTFLLRSLTVNLTVLFFWIYFFFLTLVFVLQWHFLHWKILIMLLSQFPLTFQQTQNRMPPFHCIAYNYSHADWDGLRDHLRDISWRISLNSVFLLLLVNFVSGFRSSPWFSAACAAAIFHRNYFIRLYQQNKSSESKVKVIQASNHCKRVLEAAKLAYANKTKGFFTSQKLCSRGFW